MSFTGKQNGCPLFHLPRLCYLVMFASLTAFVTLQMLSENVDLRKNKFPLINRGARRYEKHKSKYPFVLVLISVVVVKNRSRQLSQCYVQSTQDKLIDLRLRLETQPHRQTKRLCF